MVLVKCKNEATHVCSLWERESFSLKFINGGNKSSLSMFCAAFYKISSALCAVNSEQIIQSLNDCWNRVNLQDEIRSRAAKGSSMIKAHLDNSTGPQIYKHFLCIYSMKWPEFPPPGRFKQSPLMLGYNKWAHKIASPAIVSYFVHETKTKHY